MIAAKLAARAGQDAAHIGPLKIIMARMAGDHRSLASRYGRDMGRREQSVAQPARQRNHQHRRYGKPVHPLMRSNSGGVHGGILKPKLLIWIKTGPLASAPRVAGRVH